MTVVDLELLHHAMSLPTEYLGFRDAAGNTAITPQTGHEVNRGWGALADSTVRIVDDRVYVRRGDLWSDLGSAAGVTLDVGRELIVHTSIASPSEVCSGTDEPATLSSRLIEGSVDLRAFRKRADEHGDAQAASLASLVTRLSWAAQLPATGTFETSSVSFTMHGGVTMGVTTVYAPKSAPHGETVQPIPEPSNATSRNDRLAPTDLVALLTAAGRT